MALTEAQRDDLLAIHRGGRQIEVCEYIEVQWDANDSGETRYYAASQYNKIPPFGNIGHNIGPRLIGEPFKTLELYPDLRTDTIPIVFDDLDKEIRGKFQGFGSGVRVEFFLYYPQVDGHRSMWFGQLQAPQIYGRKTIETIATNGYRSREQMAPRRLRPRECGWGKFGGQLTSEARKTNGCKYDPSNGIGNYKTGSTPFEVCTFDETGCSARGMSAYYGGFKPDASAVVTDGNSGYLAVTKGNTSNLRNPIRVIFGTKTVRANQLLFWRREMNANDQDKGWVAGVWEIGEGPVRSIRNIKVGEKLIEQMHLDTRLGQPAQPAFTQYAPDIGNFSNLAMYFARKGWVDPLTENAQTMSVSECVVEGYTEVTQLNKTSAGAGLKAEYYDSTTIGTDKLFEGVVAAVNVSETAIAPVQGLTTAGGFSIKYTGTITFLYSENYTFTSEHEDDVRLIIDGGDVINQASAGSHTGNFSAAAATPYTFELRIVCDGGTGYQTWKNILKWQSTSQALEVVPSTALAHTALTGFVRSWSNNRISCLFELMHNQRYGLSYPISRFNSDKWINSTSWAGQSVTFSYTNADGETRNFAHTRTRLDVVMEGRPVAEQIVDICRSGRVSVPYQKEGEFHIEPFRAFTSSELANAKVFTDTGPTQNILWTQGKEREPMLTISQVPDDKLINEITLVFEDGQFNDQERPVTVDNPNQKLKAGRTLGGENLQSVPTRIAAYGCRNLNEVVKLGYGLLRFGEFDEGGILNNLTVNLDVPLIEAIDVERYSCIKITSDLLDGFLLPTDDQFSTFEQAEYFRVLRIVKTSRDTARITAQVYNPTAYEAFETNSSSYPPTLPPGDSEPDNEPIPVEPPSPVILNALDYNPTSGVLVLLTST